MSMDEKMSTPPDRPVTNSYVNRFFGGPPLSVVVKA